MNTRLTLTVLTVLLIVISSCKKKEVTASFDVDQEKTIDVDHQFSFTNTSENAASYEWDFGDGNTSTETNPKHSYGEKGEYTVQMTASSDNGDYKVSEMTVVVGDYAVVGLIADFSSFNFEALTDPNDTCLPLAEEDVTIIRFARTLVDVTAPGFTYSVEQGDEPVPIWNNGEILYYGMINFNSSTCGGFFIQSDEQVEGSITLVEEYFNGSIGSYTSDYKYKAQSNDQEAGANQGVAKVTVNYDIVFFDR